MASPFIPQSNQALLSHSCPSSPPLSKNAAGLSSLTENLEDVHSKDRGISHGSQIASLQTSTRGGIGLDENPSVLSSISIPPSSFLEANSSKIKVSSSSSFSLLGKDVSQVRASSLPSSPTKNTSNRTIAELRADIALMKRSSCEQNREGNEIIQNASKPNPVQSVSFGGLAPNAPMAAAQDLRLKEHSNGKSDGPQTAAFALSHYANLHGKTGSSSNTLPNPSNTHCSHVMMKDHGYYHSHSVPYQDPKHPVIMQPNDNKQSLFPHSLHKSSDNKPPNQAMTPGQMNLPSHLDITIPPKDKYSNPLSNSHADFPPLHGPHQSLTNPNHNLPSDSNQAPTNANASWADLFSSNRVKSNGTTLEYIPGNSNHENPRPPVNITMEEVTDELKRWDNALVGFVVGAKPPYKLMKQFIDRRWKAFGCIDLYILKAGLFIFNFHNEEAKYKILELGPWSYFDKPLILKPWSPNESYDRVSPDVLPIWIRLPHLKLHLWSALTLSKLASHIGRPLFTDRMTSLRQRLAYARICVEVDKHSTFPSFIEVVDYDGSTFSQPVEYEWIPSVCDACKQFGHNVNQCSMNIKQVWRPKQATPQNAEEGENTEEKSEAQDVGTTKDNNDTYDERDVHTIQAQPNISRPKIPTTISMSNKFTSLSDMEQENSQQPHPSSQQTDLNSQILHNPITVTTEEVHDEVHSPSNMEAKSPESPLSNSQRKKQEKMLYALTHKKKANQAKPSKPPYSK